MRLLRSSVSLLGRVLLGGAVLLLGVAIAMLAVGAYCVAVPASKLSGAKYHERLVAFVRVAQALAALAGVLRADSAGGETGPVDAAETVGAGTTPRPPAASGT